MVLLEWTAQDAGAATYDGEKPRELFRVQHPFSNHNGGLIAFNPLARPGTPISACCTLATPMAAVAAIRMNMAQNLSSIFGKILRIDPLGTNSKNGKYGIPADNPFVGYGTGALGEIWALGVRNPQRFGWDSEDRQHVRCRHRAEHRRRDQPGAERRQPRLERLGSQLPFMRGGVDTTGTRADDNMIFPIAEYDHTDPSAHWPRRGHRRRCVPRQSRSGSSANLIIFGDNPSGEIFHVSADNPPAGGQDPIRRVLLE